MAERQDYVALDWVSGEIDETLKQACQALEAYVEAPGDTTQLRFCLSYVNQVQGTLRMVEFHGAALFAGEMESLLQAMLNGEVQGDSMQAIEAAMAGLLHLPSYLDQVRVARQDLPGVLLPRINDMRSIRNAELMSEAAFFSPEMSAIAPATESAAVLSREEFQGMVGKLKQLFQLAFVGIVRKKQLGQNLEYLARICNHLQEMSCGTRREPLWRAAQAIVEGVSNQSIHPNAAIKSLLKEIDSELKGMQHDGAAYFDKPAPAELLKAFLYYIARSDAQSPRILQIQRSYKLKKALAQSAEQNDSRADPDALRSVVDALLEEIAAVKDYLDLHGRGGDKGMDNIVEALPLLKRVGDTMAVLGFVEPLATMRAQGEALKSFIDRGECEDRESLLSIAENIVAVEESLLAYLAPGAGSGHSEEHHQLDTAREAVLREARNGLERAKEAIIDFVASQWDHSRLEAVPSMLRALASSLDMAGTERAARILRACERYTSQCLLAEKQVPEWQMLEKLADAISGIDYFLERTAEDQLADNEAILDVAEDSVGLLGYSIDSLDDVESRVDPCTEDFAEDDSLQAVVPEAVSPEGEDTSDIVEENGTAALTGEAGGEQPAAVETGPVSSASPYPFTMSVEEETEDPLDEEIAEIFVEEAGEVLEAIAQNLPQWCAESDNEKALSEIRRAFHTLKGSGRMVGACMLGELAWSVEGMLNKIIEQGVTPATIHSDLVVKIVTLVPPMVAAFEGRKPLNKSYVDGVSALVQALVDGENVDAADLMAIDPRWLEPANCRAADDVAGQAQDTDELEQEPVAEFSNGVATTDTQDNHEPGATLDAVDDPSAVEGAQSEDNLAAVEEQNERDTLLEIFGAEAESHLVAMQEFIAQAEASAEPLAVSDGLQRALHTLKGCARMAEVDALGIIVAPLESLVKQLQAARIGVDQDVVDVIRDTTRLAFIGLTLLKEQGHCVEFSETPSLLGRIESLIESRIPSVPEDSGDDSAYLSRVGEFMIETADRLASVTAILDGWKERGEANEGDWFIVGEYTGKIAATAGELELEPLAGLALAWSAAAERVAPCPVGDEIVALFEQVGSTLEGMLDSLAADQAFAPVDSDLQARLDSLEPVSVEAEAPRAGVDDESVDDSGAEQFIEAPAPAEEQTRSHTPPVTEHTLVVADDDDIDQEMVEIFMEEARDLLEKIDETIHQWLEDRQSRSCLEMLQRCLHTLKGGARLTGLRSLGNLSHNFETFLISAEEHGVAFDNSFFARVQQYQDQVVIVVEQVMTGEPVADIEEQEPELPEASAEPVEMIDLPQADKAQSEPATAAAPVVDNSQMRVVTQEAVKMPAHVIEQLVNLAGETSINRSRVEEQVGEVMFSLAEMEATIERMQEQLRRLDIETEQQLIFRQEQVESMGLEEFDPLEMDRYSVLQQLSRSLAESSSDIKEVKNSIFNKSRDIETLLLQQSRINTDLQERLMRSRMVPFSRLVPRLRRIVRQVSVELNKNVNLEFLNTEGEMDRTILERMVPSFEHMLRNAVDHGIEDENKRAAAGKPLAGNISISLAREGGEVVLTLADDGRGIDLEAVRSKAIERGMMSADATLSDHEVLQFILQSGFSTAQAITQISGRGVGLDVVASEIKQIGGSVDIKSDFGRGTRFVIRLPFTVSVNRALMVQSCGETYALPLNTIEGIVRVSPFELEAYYQPDAPLFEYAGQSYKLRYMGALIRKTASPDLQDETLPLPVILVRSGENSFAVQVDQLLGSREIVVKALGPQFSAAQGLSGATVLGDGSVVVILDLHAMIRTDLSMPQLNEMIESKQEEEVEENRNLLVMVVDDSVTVRKVTSRLLERNGMDVLLAKDGVDAMQLLQDHKPDCMLLDIEMPRMDGFEVASRVKSGSKLKNLPIIMITSRTGEKHRERAESIGVDKYLGKPFQEMELLANIQELTGNTP